MSSVPSVNYNVGKSKDLYFWIFVTFNQAQHCSISISMEVFEQDDFYRRF